VDKIPRMKFRSAFNRKSKACPEPRRRIENLKWLGLSVIVFVLVVAGAVAQAQQPKKVSRIRILTSADPASEFTRFEAIRQARLFDQTLRTK
jgi:hypothetical protein